LSNATFWQITWDAQGNANLAVGYQQLLYGDSSGAS